IERWGAVVGVVAGGAGAIAVVEVDGAVAHAVKTADAQPSENARRDNCATDEEGDDFKSFSCDTTGLRRTG
ncbi:hypothetical protein, partial [Caballeronia sp.]|uniref:hypothetical protein n=1 Tax=Caballeronia sp. TaxID=1931223 RepID=UPI003C536F4E